MTEDNNIFKYNDDNFFNSDNFIDKGEDSKRKMSLLFEEVFESLKKYSKNYDKDMLQTLKDEKGFFNKIVVASLRIFSPENYNVEKLIDSIDYDYIRNEFFNRIDEKLDKNNEETNVSWWYNGYKNACEEEIVKYDYNEDSLMMVCNNMTNARNKVYEIKNGVKYDSVIEKYIDFFDNYMNDKQIIISNGMKNYLFENFQDYIKESKKIVNKKNDLEEVDSNISLFSKECGIHIDDEKKRENSIDDIFIY